MQSCFLLLVYQCHSIAISYKAATVYAEVLVQTQQQAQFTTFKSRLAKMSLFSEVKANDNLYFVLVNCGF